jgi:hypothetical protein
MAHKVLFYILNALRTYLYDGWDPSHGPASDPTLGPVFDPLTPISSTFQWLVGYTCADMRFLL